MKNKIKTKGNDPVHFFLSEIGFRDKKASRLTLLLKGYNIYNVNQLIGAFCPAIPKLSKKDLKKRGIASSPVALAKLKKPDEVIKRLQRVLKVPKSEAARIYSKFHKIPEKSHSYTFNFNWSLGGQKKRTKKRRDQFWETAPAINIESDFHVVPEYETAGSIFDQGERGTCVANAFGTLLNYKSNRQISRQFLYHQCKMLDGIPDEEGTYMDMPSKVLNRIFTADYGCISEEVWPYNPFLNYSKAQGPPPERSFNCTRVLLEGQIIEPRREKKVKDIKYLLNYVHRNKSCPVAIGLELYPSFFSKSTSESGWVTMPLPGEPVMGYHAMIIVGYDEVRKLFLVRNSWGPKWAADHDKGFHGHAWIPYEYVEKYGFDPQTVESVKVDHVIVAPENRLYNNRKSSATKKIAALGKKKRTGNYQGHRTSFLHWLVRAAIIVLLWNAYDEPIKKIANQTLEIVKSKIDLDMISRKTKNYIDENISFNNKNTEP